MAAKPPVNGGKIVIIEALLQLKVKWLFFTDMQDGPNPGRSCMKVGHVRCTSAYR